jgi:hypothetical protein
MKWVMGIIGIIVMVSSCSVQHKQFQNRLLENAEKQYYRDNPQKLRR